MPSIYIANTHNENMVLDHRVMDMAYRLSSVTYSHRMSWLIEAGDIILLPRAPSPEFITYVGKWMGFSPENVVFLAPQSSEAGVSPLGYIDLLDSHFIDQIKVAMGKRQGWQLRPYLHDRTIYLLAEKLGLVSSQSSSFRGFLRGGAEMLNDKEVFRNLALGQTLPIAPGEICRSPTELDHAIKKYIGYTGSVIIKENRHCGGDGNVVVTLSSDTLLQGTLHMLYFSNLEDSTITAQRVWDELALGLESVLIVEVYYPIRSSPCVEFELDASRHHVRLTYVADQKIVPIFSGVSIPLELPPHSMAQLIAGATQFAHLVCHLGFSGVMGVDAILTMEGEILFTETNVRYTAASHIHHIASKLLGENYGDFSFVHFNKKIHTKIKDFAELTSIPGLAFDQQSKKGILITAEDLANSDVIEFMAIGRTREEADHLEAEFKRVIA